ncbi:MAG: hypothetical protein LUG93_07575 [Lachnospiraceae bacterium]|nr:hypothetical protein [Lachnospiraceae bacterium]
MSKKVITSIPFDSSIAESMPDDFQPDSGLPKGIHTEQQLWDEILKKEVYETPFLLLPLIREIYGEEYPKETPVTPIATEFSVERPDSKEISGIRSDTTLKVGRFGIFHFECEISTDSDMGRRTYDYDSRIALTYPERQKKKPVLLRYPHSTVLYLSPGSKIAKARGSLVCRLFFPPGQLIPTARKFYSLTANNPETENTSNAETLRQSTENERKSRLVSEKKLNRVKADNWNEENSEIRNSEKSEKSEKLSLEIMTDQTTELSYVDYLIPTVKVQAYSLQEIHEKKLLILIPYTPIRFRPLLGRMKKEPTFAKKQLTKFYQEIILTLDEAVTDSYISERERKVILSLLRKAMIRVFCKTPFLEEVTRMTAPILELEWETVERLKKEITVLTAEKNAITAEKNAITAEKDAITAENARKDAVIAERDEEIRMLRKRRPRLFYRRRKDG